MTTDNFKEHPIQLVNIYVNELSYNRPEPQNNEDDFNCQVITGRSEFDPETDLITCGVKCICGKQQGESEVRLLVVEIVGLFKVDKQNFPINQIPAWQDKNAPFILLPYLREQVYSLSLRAGIEPIILPTYIVPTTKSTVQKESS
jgi:preprotein translocase subunit SecB